MEGLRLRNVEKEIFSKLIEIFGEKKIQSIAHQFRMTPYDMVKILMISARIKHPQDLINTNPATIYNILVAGRGKGKSHMSESMLCGSSQISENRAPETASRGSISVRRPKSRSNIRVRTFGEKDPRFPNES